MLIWSINILTTLLLCLILAGILIPQILLISFRKKLFDDVDERKIHQGAVPRLGGIAFMPVIIFVISLLSGVNIMIGNYALCNALTENPVLLTFTVCAFLLIYLVGIADDLIGVRYRAKFTVQIMVGCLIIMGGLYIDNLHGLFGIYELPLWIAYPLTLLVIVFIMNAINLIDGIDGLASGICGVAILFYGGLFYYMGSYLFCMLAMATLGVLIPFFYYNVFGKIQKHKKIFMGDSGSLTIGLILSILSIQTLMELGHHSEIALHPFMCAFAPLFVPCFDVVRVFFLRIKNGKSPFLPDNNHLHHKLIQLGFGQHQTMVYIILLSISLIAINVILSPIINVTILMLADLLIWVLGDIWISHAIKKRDATKELTNPLKNN